jgi:hypothetical protein
LSYVFGSPKESAEVALESGTELVTPQIQDLVLQIRNALQLPPTYAETIQPNSSTALTEDIISNKASMEEEVVLIRKVFILLGLHKERDY